MGVLVQRQCRRRAVQAAALLQWHDAREMWFRPWQSPPGFPPGDGVIKEVVVISPSQPNLLATVFTKS